MAERNTFWVMARAKQWIVRHDDVDLATLPSRTHAVAVAINRAKADRLESYDLSFASAAARATREAGALMHPGDLRWRATEKDALAKTQADEVQRYFEPLLSTGPIEAIIIGDVDLDKAMAVRRGNAANASPAR